MNRRHFLHRALRSAAGFGLSASASPLVIPLVGCAAGDVGAITFGPLEAADANGLRLPAGFSSRIVATSGVAVAGTGFIWHAAPDGGATFALPSGGWIYVSNAELTGSAGGVSALRFAADGSVEDAYSILSGTRRNCAGGATPWQTWLSCEEWSGGRVFECDPSTPGSEGVVRPALGVFTHEAAAVDPVFQRIYLTEDENDGLLYRFTPTRYPDLSDGLLEAAEILDPSALGPIVPGERRALAWHTIPDPSATTMATRFQAAPATPFDGGEGCAYRDGQLFFSTKGDHRVWRIDTALDRIEMIYDRATDRTGVLSNPDNVFAASSGDVYVAEDPGDLQIVALTSDGRAIPIVQITGQAGSEVTGPALSPDGTRLYFSSQRYPGTTYEVNGPFTAA